MFFNTGVGARKPPYKFIRLFKYLQTEKTPIFISRKSQRF